MPSFDPTSRSSDHPIPDHGDLAANLAMRLARPMRRSPLQIAEVLAENLRAVAVGTVDDGGAGGAAGLHQPAALAQRGWKACWMRPARPAMPSAESRQERPLHLEHRVRLGQPDRPAHCGQRSRRLRRRPAVLACSRAAATPSRVSTTSTIRVPRSAILGASVAARRTGRGGARGGLSRRLRR